MFCVLYFYKIQMSHYVVMMKSAIILLCYVIVDVSKLFHYTVANKTYT
jgi:succinate dehydrogenase hydrophobic anchor subunit